jgi:hypothetical protein
LGNLVCDFCVGRRANEAGVDRHFSARTEGTDVGGGSRGEGGSRTGREEEGGASQERGDSN